MAVLQEQMSKSVNPFIEQIKDDLAPAGTWIATIIDIRDQFGVVRPTFDNPSVTEVVDLTTFLFGFRDQAGQPQKFASKTMRISGNEKSNLFGFLKSALGSTPKYKKCLITIAHEAKRNGQGVFPTIAALCPVPAGMAAGVPAAVAPQAAPVAPSPAPAHPTLQAPAGAYYPNPPATVPADDEPLPF
jgi:hypothetical protein